MPDTITKYQCRQCGDVFETERAAAHHAERHDPMPWGSGRPAGAGIGDEYARRDYRPVEVAPTIEERTTTTRVSDY